MRNATGDTGRRAGLSPAKIATAALQLVDERGVDALSMRKLADALDVTPMAIYNHVAGRDEVERLVVDRIFAEWTAPVAEDASPRSRLVDVLGALRTAYLRHPNAIALVQTVPTGEDSSLDLIERALTALMDAGLTLERARTTWIGLVSLVNGHVGYELQGHFSDPAFERCVPDGYETLRAAVRLGAVDYDTIFHASLHGFLDGIGLRPES